MIRIVLRMTVAFLALSACAPATNGARKGRARAKSRWPATTAVREADLFDNCIRSKGFELVPVKEE